MSSSEVKNNLVSIEDILTSFSLSILEKKTEEEVIWSLVKDCISALDFEDCVIYFVDEKRKNLKQRAAHGPKNPDGERILSPITIPLGEGITGSVAKTGEAIIIHDTSKDSRYIVDDAQRLSEICVPIMIDNQVIGVIDCEHSERYFFTEDHLHFLTVISKICAIKLAQLDAERSRKAQLEETHRVKLQLAQLQTKVLKSHLNPHFVFNTLNSIQYFLTEDNRKLALDYLTLFSKIIRYYLGNFENDLINVSQELDAVSNYLMLQKLRYDKGFSYHVSKTNLNSSKEDSIPPLLLIAATDEIIEHHLSENGQLKVEVKAESKDDALLLSFEYEYRDEQRSSTGFRKNMVSWKDQVDYFNELKGQSIKYSVSSVEITEQKKRSKLTITIPQ